MSPKNSIRKPSLLLSGRIGMQAHVAEAGGQRAFYRRGWCQAQKGSAEKTLAEFKEFLAKYPKSALAPDAQFWVADFYARRQDYINAQQQFDLLAKNYPTNELADVAQYFAGRAAYSRQDYKTAKESFEADEAPGVVAPAGPPTKPKPIMLMSIGMCCAGICQKCPRKIQSESRRCYSQANSSRGRGKQIHY